MTLHRAGEALALADGSDIDELALHKGVGLDLLADFEAIDRIEAQLDETTTSVDTRLREVAGFRLGQLLGIAVAIGHLQRGVSVAFGGLDLHDARGFNAEHGDGHDLVVNPHLAHGDFLAHDRFQCHLGSLFGWTRKFGYSDLHANAPLARWPAEHRSWVCQAVSRCRDLLGHRLQCTPAMHRT